MSAGPTQGRLAPTTSREAAFTLIEILVVLVILSIAAGLGVVALAPDHAALARREAQRFAGALEYAAARAQWRAETLGVDAAGSAVRFFRQDPATSEWRLVRDDDVLAARTLDEPLTAVPWSYGGRRLAPHTLVPLRPSGRNEPATFVIAADEARLVVALDPLDRVTIASP